MKVEGISYYSELVIGRGIWFLGSSKFSFKVGRGIWFSGHSKFSFKVGRGIWFFVRTDFLFDWKESLYSLRCHKSNSRIFQTKMSSWQGDENLTKLSYNESNSGRADSSNLFLIHLNQAHRHSRPLEKFKTYEQKY